MKYFAGAGFKKNTMKLLVAGEAKFTGA